YEINPDPERVFYAHSTFVQSYLEQGPLGAIGMLALPVMVLGAALLARRYGAVRQRRPLLIAGLGVVGAMEAHGLTDQVVTTNIGTGLVLLGLAAIVAGLSPAALDVLGRAARRAGLALTLVTTILVLGVLATRAGRAQSLLY